MIFFYFEVKFLFVLFQRDALTRKEKENHLFTYFPLLFLSISLNTIDSYLSVTKCRVPCKQN